MARTKTTALAALALLAGCATTPEENPPECAPVVAQHRADPTLEVDVEPRPRGAGSVRRVEMPARSYRVSFVVDETGAVETSTITATPSPPDLAAIRDELSRRRYFPARVDGCMVPSRTTGSVTLGG